MTSARATFFHYLGQRKTQLAIGILCAAATALAGVMPPRFIGAIIDALQQGTTFQTVVLLALASVGFSAADAVFRGIARYLLLNTARQAEYQIRNDLFAHLQKLHLAYFQHQRIGDLMARLTNDLTAVRQMLGPALMQGSFTIMTFVFAVLSMLGVSVKLTVISMILMPIASLAFWYVGRKVHVRFERLQAKFGDLSTKAQENFSGIRVVKAFSQEEPEAQDFARVNREYVGRAVELTAVQGLIWPTMSFVLGLAVLSVLYIGGQDAIRGELTLGQLVQFVAYLYLLSWPVIAIGWISNMFQAGWASLVRLQEIFDAKPAIADPIDAVTTPVRGEVELRGVSFAYGQAIVLHDVSFKVPAGGSLAIVGPTGSGKSTLVNLIPLLFDVQQGEALIDAINVRRYPLHQLRRAVVYVPQERRRSTGRATCPSSTRTSRTSRRGTTR
ncbi:MAG: ATP-binding cassette domain-containing protein [Chloroflexi bacterium]|nr:MAG: ATP-binding cassette domain-containing protein [Chloroflexota bacterium]